MTGSNDSRGDKLRSDLERKKCSEGGPVMACKLRRWVLIFVALCSFFHSEAMASASTRVLSIYKSGQHARIDARNNGKPLAGIRVEVYRGFGWHDGLPHSKALLLLTSNQLGEVTLPTLPDGEYLILALSKPNLEDWLYLDVSSDERSRQSFDLNLWPQPPTFAEKLAAAEASTEVATVSEIRGIVFDPTGAHIPKATVEVLVKGTQGKRHAATLRTGADGEFSAEMPEGQYVLIVSALGFVQYFRLVTVSRLGSSDALQIKLQILPAS